MKRKANSRASEEAVRDARNELRTPPAATNGFTAYPGLVGIELGVPYSRRFEPPYGSGRMVRDDEEEEDYDICQ
ncbi:MAG: hypothetical protein IJR90_01925 [Clostridia bacterium]|nr:hypothetical protein [Clostridia bacterium]